MSTGAPPEEWKILGLRSTLAKSQWEGPIRALLKDGELKQAHPRGFVLDIVQNALRRNKIRLNIFEEDNFVLVFVVGMQDWTMISLAKESKAGFPRGFCLVFAVDDLSCHGLTFVAISAFLDKFSNDDRTVDAPLKEFSDSTVRIAQKVSGSLSLLTAFEWKSQKYALFTAKNSTGNVYTRECAALLGNWFAIQKREGSSFYQFLLDHSYVCAFEVCSMAHGMGQHGSIYKENMTIALLLASTSSNEKIIKVVPDEISVPKLRDFGVPVLSRWVSTSDSGRDAVLGEIIAQRDHLTNSKFEEVMQRGVTNGKFSVVPGNVDHDLLTNVLEGLVIWTSKKGIIKFKLPRYTVMTMCLRPLIQIHGNQMSDSNTRRQLSDYLERWVLTAPARDFYDSLVRFVVHRLRKTEAATKICSDDYLYFAEPLVEEFTKNVASSIASLPAEVLDLPIQVYLVVGTVGWGKSTLLKKLAADHDLVGLSFDDCEEDTKGGGSTKNVRLWGSAAFHLSRARPIAIENGGGAFFGKGDQIDKNLHQRCLCLPDVEPVLVVPQEIVDICNDSKEEKEFRAAASQQTDLVVVERFETANPVTGGTVYQIGPKQRGRDRAPMGRFETKEEAQRILRGVTQKNFKICMKLVDFHRRRNSKIISYKRGPSGITLSEQPSVRIPAGVKCKGNYMLSIQAYTLLEKAYPYTGHVTAFYAATAERADKFWANRDSLRCTLPGRPLKVRVDSGEDVVAAILLDVAEDNPLLQHVSPDQIPHMSIECPYSASKNNEVLKVALSRPAGSSFPFQIDDRVFTFKLEADTSEQVNLYEPYCFVMTGVR